MNLNTNQLRKELIEIHEKYLKNPNNKFMIAKAKRINTKYIDAMPLLKKEMQHAVNLLVDIYSDLKKSGRPSKRVVEKILKELN